MGAVSTSSLIKILDWLKINMYRIGQNGFGIIQVRDMAKYFVVYGTSAWADDMIRLARLSKLIQWFTTSHFTK